VTSVALTLFSARALLAQHSFTPEEVADGVRICGSSCPTCHSPKGGGVSGALIMSGKFKCSSSDDDLSKLVRNGIPISTVQAQRDLSETQAGAVVACL